MTLRTGYTTGSCAAAAAKAASALLQEDVILTEAEIELPDASRVSLPVLWARRTPDGAEAAVKKDAGDDPDITNGASIVVNAQWIKGRDIVFSAGEGVGMVTKPGLQVPPGEPAINPVPRDMITAAVRAYSDRGVKVTISIPGGEELAQKTFNPRLGIVGGLSILGTTGIVRPFSCKALRESLVCAIDVAEAVGVRSPVLVPGHLGERAAKRHLRLTPEQIILVSNEWGYMLDYAAEHDFERLLVAGHPGKLAKLADGQWDTHSSRSDSAVLCVQAIAQAVLRQPLPDTPTTEGIFMLLTEDDRRLLGNAVAEAVQMAVRGRLKGMIDIGVLLVNMQADILGTCGNLQPWQ